MCKSSCGVCRLGASVRLGRCTSVSYVNQPDGCQTDHHRCNSIICDCCSLRLKQRQGHTSERAGSRLQSGATRRVLNNMVGGGLWSATFKVRAHGIGKVHSTAVCAHWENTQRKPCPGMDITFLRVRTGARRPCGLFGLCDGSGRRARAMSHSTLPCQQEDSQFGFPSGIIR